ncbi:MAG: hypothetical protein Q7T96_07875, partial [Methylobacter sp.]|nr:hypothetical protein [Methylobacter sp.]
MRRRLLLLFLPSIYAPVTLANEAVWNCAQSKVSKEWVCVGEKNPVDKAGAAKVPDHTEDSGSAQQNSVNEAQTTPSEAVEEAQPALAEPERVNAAKTPASAEPSGNAQQSPVDEEQPAAVDQSAGSGLARKAPEGARAGTARDENAVAEPQPGTAENAKLQAAPAEHAERPVSAQADNTRQVDRSSANKNSLQTESNRPGW